MLPNEQLAELEESVTVFWLGLVGEVPLSNFCIVRNNALTVLLSKLVE